MKTILEDERPIKIVRFNNEEQYEVGRSGCTKIAAYGENGEFCVITWIAVYKNDVIVTRFPASRVEIVYDTKEA